MAIASTEPEPSAPSIILGVVRVPLANLRELEQRMRQKELVILQKKQLELSQEESKSWFSEPQTDESGAENTGYVLQGRETSQIWENLTKEVGNSICGIAPNEDLRRLFPSIVLDQYLLQPTWTTQYLNQLKPVLLAGMQEICDDKPEDPVEYLANFLMEASRRRQSQE